MWSRASSNFIALSLSRLIRQTSPFFLQLNSKRLYQSLGKEKQGRCLVFTSSTKREIWHFHDVYSGSDGKETYKRARCTSKFFFANLNLLLFSRSRWRRRCRCLSSLLSFPDANQILLYYGLLVVAVIIIIYYYFFYLQDYISMLTLIVIHLVIMQSWHLRYLEINHHTA